MGGRAGGGASGGMGSGVRGGGSVESRVQSAIKKAGWKNNGGGEYELDTGDNGIGGASIFASTSSVNKMNYGQETVYNVQNVWDKNYNIVGGGKSSTFASLKAAKDFVQSELIKVNK